MNSKMSKFLLTYTTNGEWSGANTIIVEAYEMKDVEKNLTDVLTNFGLDLADADEIETNKWFYVADMVGIDATVQY